MTKQNNRRLTICRLALILLCALAACTLLLRREENQLTVLMYHNLTLDAAACSDYTLLAEDFRRDLQWLQDNGYTTVLPRELLQGCLDDGSPLPRRLVMLTFDDGYASNFELAFPLLQEYRAKAVVSLIVECIDRGAQGFLSWEQCRRMQQSGLVEFGCHTYNHHITENGALGISRRKGEEREAYLQRIGGDLDRACGEMRRQLGAAPLLFAYPLGQCEGWAEPLLRLHFSVTVTSRPGRARLRGGLYRLPRYNVTPWQRAGAFLA